MLFRSIQYSTQVLLNNITDTGMTYTQLLRFYVIKKRITSPLNVNSFDEQNLFAMWYKNSQLKQWISHSSHWNNLDHSGFPKVIKKLCQHSLVKRALVIGLIWNTLYKISYKYNIRCRLSAIFLYVSESQVFFGQKQINNKVLCGCFTKVPH